MLAGSSQNPHFTNLNTLFLTEDAGDNSDKIWEYLAKFPDAVHSLFLVERNILHMSILKKREVLVRKLLEQHPALLYQRDKSQQVALHHAIVAYEHTILTMIIEAAPEQVDAQRNDGRTPLHLALSLGIPPAIDKLIRARANVYIQDYNGRSGYDIAKKSQEVFSVMTSWEDRLFETQVRDSAAQSDTTIDELTKKFVLLKINPAGQSIEHALLPDEYGQFNHDAIVSHEAVPLNDVVNGDMSKLHAYLSQGGDPNAKQILERPILVCLFLKATHIHDAHEDFDPMQGQKFLHLAKYASLATKDRGGRDLFDYVDLANPGKVKLINQLYSLLRVQAGKLRLHYTASMNSLNEQFINVLLFAGLQKLNRVHSTIKAGPPEKPAPAPENAKQVIDDLCKGFTPYNFDSAFDANYVSNMSFGLLSRLTAHEILSHIKSKWPAYSLEQKLIANFIVKELLIFDFSADCHVIDTSDIEFMLRGNVETFPMHAIKLNALFERLFQFRDFLLHNNIYLNYKMLSKWQKETPLDHMMPSFHDLIRATVNSPHKHRKAYIKRIAAELSSLSCKNLTAVSIEEFYNKAWSGAKSHELSPNIMFSIKTTNDLVNFIQEVIVSANDIQEAKRLYELFVSVAAELCRSKSLSGPDMASVFIVMGALNCSKVDRLKKVFGDIDKVVAKKIDLLNKLIKPSRNYVWLRKAESTHQVAIPYLGKLLTDITFIYDGNDNWSVACEMLGMRFKQFMEQQAHLVFAPVLQTTDIVHLMKTHAFLGAERMYEMSTKLLPPEITIDKYSVSQIIFTMNNFISDKVVPNVNFNGRNYKAHAIVAAIFAQLKMQLLKERGSETFNEDIIKSRKMIAELILLVNSRNPEVTVNYLNYTFQLHEIKESVIVPKLELPAEPILYLKIEKSASLPDGVASSSSSSEMTDRRKSKKNSARL